MLKESTWVACLDSVGKGSLVMRIALLLLPLATVIHFVYGQYWEVSYLFVMFAYEISISPRIVGDHWCICVLEVPMFGGA